MCGLLNSPDGGTLVIGVLEVEREMERGEASRLLKWLADEFGYQVPKDSGGDLRRPLPNAVLGVEHEYGDTGHYRDADRYLAALRDTLKDHIEPNPWPWLRMATRSVEAREIVVLTVRSADTWCYATLIGESDPQFFVREGASTRAYRGTEADLYRRAHLRSS